MAIDIETLKTMLEKDLRINDAELDTESLRIPQIHNKYLNFYHDEKLLLQSYRMKRRTILREKWEYYTGKMDADTLEKKGLEPFNLKILKQDVDMYIESDAEMVAIDSKVSLQQEKVDYLEQAIKAINNLQWHIRDAIAWRKFINGVN
jgi:hypothetical protein